MKPFNSLFLNQSAFKGGNTTGTPFWRKLMVPLALSLILSLLPLGGLAVFAEYSDPGSYEDRTPAFRGLTGVVEEIVPFPGSDNLYRVVIEEDADGPYSFTITNDTVFFTEDRPEVGDTVTGFYDVHAPMILIYPPQYTAVAMAVNPGDANVFVGYFDEDLVDPDNTLMLIITEDTLVQLPDGQPYEGSLKNQTLAVMYGASTRSIPAQTRPEKVIVLGGEDEVAEVETNDREEAALEEGMEPFPDDESTASAIISLPDVSTAQIVVNNAILENAPAAWTSEKGVIMVPLKHIAEALGYNVLWNGDLRLVMLSDSFTLTIGQDAYVDMNRDEPVTLGTAPVIRDSRTFVPLHYFRYVIPMNNAYFFENQIVIDNEERMN